MNISSKIIEQHGLKPDEFVSIKKLLKREKEYGLFDESVWQDFAKNVYKSKNDLTTLLLDIKSKGQTVVGNSCPCRASVLINFCGIGSKTLRSSLDGFDLSFKIDKIWSADIMPSPDKP